MHSSFDANQARGENRARIDNFVSSNTDANIRSPYTLDRTLVGSHAHLGSQIRSAERSTRSDINLRASYDAWRPHVGVAHSQVNSADLSAFMKKKANVDPVQNGESSRVRSHHRVNSNEILALGRKELNLRTSQDTDRTRVGISHSHVNSVDNLAAARRDRNKSSVSLANTIIQGDLGDRSWFTGNSFETERDFDFDFDLETGEQQTEDSSDPPKRQKGQKEEKEKGDKKDPNLIEWDGPADPDNPMNVSNFPGHFILLLAHFANFNAFIIVSELPRHSK